MKPTRQQVTLAAIRDRLELLEANCALVGLSGGRAGIAALGYAGYVEAKDFRTIGCRYNFESLFGTQPTPSQSAAHSRTIRQLVAAGLVEQEISRVRLTDAGRLALQEAEA